MKQKKKLNEEEIMHYHSLINDDIVIFIDELKLKSLADKNNKKLEHECYSLVFKSFLLMEFLEYYCELKKKYEK